MDGREDPLSAIRTLFADGEPRTTAEVTVGAGVDETTARETLSDLVDVGELARKSVGRDETVTVWYPTAASGTDLGNGRGAPDRDVGGLRGDPTSLDERADDVASELAGELDADLEAAIADQSIPGASEMMQSWRRDALRAAAEFLAGRGRVRSSAVVENVYPGNRAGYRSREEWWAFVAERLASLPGVTRHGDVWEYGR